MFDWLKKAPAIGPEAEKARLMELSEKELLTEMILELKGISEEFRGNLSHLVTHAVTQRIDAHMEQINCHPMEIRRYYRQFDY